MSAALRIVLDERRFRDLVAGHEVAISGGVQLKLANMGLARMMRAVLDGQAPPDPALAAGMPKGPPDPPQAREFLPNEFTRTRRR